MLLLLFFMMVLLSLLFFMFVLLLLGVAVREKPTLAPKCLYCFSCCLCCFLCCFCCCFVVAAALAAAFGSPTVEPHPCRFQTFKNVKNNFTIDETPLTSEKVKNKIFVSRKNILHPKKKALVSPKKALPDDAQSHLPIIRPMRKKNKTIVGSPFGRTPVPTHTTTRCHAASQKVQPPLRFLDILKLWQDSNEVNEKSAPCLWSKTSCGMGSSGGPKIAWSPWATASPRQAEVTLFPKRMHAPPPDSLKSKRSNDLGQTGRVYPEVYSLASSSPSVSPQHPRNHWEQFPPTDPPSLVGGVRIPELCSSLPPGLPPQNRDTLNN